MQGKHTVLDVPPQVPLRYEPWLHDAVQAAQTRLEVAVHGAVWYSLLLHGVQAAHEGVVDWVHAPVR